MAWALGGAAAFLLVVVVCLWPLRFEMSAQARGEPDGSWVAAGGVTLGLFGVAFVWARGIPPRLSLVLAGRRLSWKPDWTRRANRSVPKPVRRVSSRLWSRLDPLGLSLQILQERRHVRLRFCVLDLDYGFRDPLLTGRLVGALSMLSGVLPPPIEIRQNPRWDFEDRWAATLSLRAVLRPWLMFLDVLIYVVRQLTHERHQDRGRRPEPAPGSPGSLQERDDRGGAAASR